MRSLSNMPTAPSLTILVVKRFRSLRSLRALPNGVDGCTAVVSF